MFLIISIITSIIMYVLYVFSHHVLFLWLGGGILILGVIAFIGEITKKFPILLLLFSGIALLCYAAGGHYHNPTYYTYAKISLAIFIIQLICFYIVSKTPEQRNEEAKELRAEIRQRKRDDRERMLNNREKQAAEQKRKAEEFFKEQKLKDERIRNQNLNNRW